MRIYFHLENEKKEIKTKYSSLKSGKVVVCFFGAVVAAHARANTSPSPETENARSTEGGKNKKNIKETERGRENGSTMLQLDVRTPHSPSRSPKNNNILQAQRRQRSGWALIAARSPARCSRRRHSIVALSSLSAASRRRRLQTHGRHPGWAAAASASAQPPPQPRWRHVGGAPRRWRRCQLWS